MCNLTSDKETMDPVADPLENMLEACLFFNVGALSRTLLRLAEREFKPLHLSPAHASVMLVLYDCPGISPKQLSRLLNLTPSTITRFIDSLEQKRLVHRKSQGKYAFITPSKKGLDLRPAIALAYKQLFQKYTRILGTIPAGRLSMSLLHANQKLSQHIEST